jgi:Arc/MetJ family transcription regulator
MTLTEGVSEVYGRCMARTNIDIDEDLVREVMRRYSLSTKKEAVDLALRRLVGVPLTKEFLLGLRGTGWSGDLDAMRDDAPASWGDE